MRDIEEVERDGRLLGWADVVSRGSVGASERERRRREVARHSEATAQSDPVTLPEIIIPSSPSVPPDESGPG